MDIYERAKWLREQTERVRPTLQKGDRVASWYGDRVRVMRVGTVKTKVWTESVLGGRCEIANVIRKVDEADESVLARIHGRYEDLIADLNARIVQATQARDKAIADREAEKLTALFAPSDIARVTT